MEERLKEKAEMRMRMELDKEDITKKSNGMSTKASHAGWNFDKEYGMVVPPITLSTTFKQKSPGVPYGEFDYIRSGNLSRSSLEETVAILENANYGLAFSSGSMALCTLSMLLDANSHVVMINDVYGGTRRYLISVASKTQALQVSDVEMASKDLMELKNCLRADTKMVWIESPTNPTLIIVDIERVVKIVKESSPEAIIVVDNTFMTPMAQKPLKLGANVVVHSATKFLNGHSDVLLGLICLNDKILYEKLKFLQNALGGVPSPFDCYLCQRGIRTLSLRVERQASNALQIAKWLEGHPKVSRVIYPGLSSHLQHEIALKQHEKNGKFGSMISCYIRGNSKTFVESTKLWLLAESLGGIKSLLEIPALMTHASLSEQDRNKLNITDSLVRMSVGIEDVEDLINDLEQAFDKI